MLRTSTPSLRDAPGCVAHRRVLRWVLLWLAYPFLQEDIQVQIHHLRMTLGQVTAF